jgi:uncharacterized damage-inducible protein DinB
MLSSTTEETMTYYGAKDLAESFRTVRKNTIQIAQDIPEDKYSFKAAPEARTVEKLLTHIALASRFQYHINAIERLSSLENFDFMAWFQKMGAEEAKSRTKAEVIDLLTKEGEIWANFVAGTSEEFLSQLVTFPQGATPPAKTRFELFLAVKEHEMHHRAQLMLIERIVGIVPHLTRQMQERMTRRQQETQR